VTRTAVLDIGTNSTRLLIADVKHARVSEELERRSTVTRLGAGVDKEGRLNQEAMERVYTTLTEYRELIQRHQADHAVAVLTSAVRDASNGQDLADAVRDRFHFKPFVLSGDEEAQLTFLGAMSERDPDDRTPTLVVDIGGGSTELVIGHGHRASFHVSTQAGVVRQTERHLHRDPPPARDQHELAANVQGIFAAAVPTDRRRAVHRVIAVAGTATSLGAIAQDLEPYDPGKVHGYRLDRRRCEQILERLAALPLDRRREVKGLDPARAPTIVAGVIILIEVLKLFGIDQLEVSEHDLLRGAALGLSD
jgi:exopolyphosphatase/guanosine-5'-triphosphate,3'-diphosphate pyrophosphatase